MAWRSLWLVLLLHADPATFYGSYLPDCLLAHTAVFKKEAYTAFHSALPGIILRILCAGTDLLL